MHNFFSAREMVLNGFKRKIFSIKSKGSGLLNTDRSKLKILTPKKKVQNNSESLLNEIRQIVYSLYQSKKITRKVYNNIAKSI